MSNIQKSLTLEKLIVFSILLVSFRFIIGLIFKVPADYLRLLNLAPLLVASIFVLMDFNSMALRRNKFVWMVILGLLILITHFALATQIYGVHPFHILIPTFASISYTLAFPLFLLLTKISRQKYYWLLEKTALIVALVGGALILMEIFAVNLTPLRPDMIRRYLIPDSTSPGGAITYNFGSVRLLGFLFDLSGSATFIGASVMFLASDIIWNPSRKRSRWSIIAVFVGTIAVLSSTSLSNILLFCAASASLLLFSSKSRALGLSTYAHIKKIFFEKKSRTNQLCYLFAILVLISPLAWHFYRHIINYLVYGIQTDLLPNFSGCQDLIWVKGFQMGSKTCHIGEFHILTSLKYYGAIPSLPWILASLSPFILVFRYRQLSPDQIPILVAALYCVAGSIHYNALAKWGPNYFFFAALAALFCTEPEQSNSKP